MFSFINILNFLLNVSLYDVVKCCLNKKTHYL